MITTDEPAGVVVRLVEADDLEMLAVLDKEVFGDVAYSPHYLRTFFNLFRTTWYVAEHDGELAGYALVGLSSDSSGSSGKKEAWLLGLAVSSRHQGHGLASKLMTKAMEVCRREGVSDAFITVRPDNAAVSHLYHQFGFVQVGAERENYYGNGEPRKVLHRSLKANP
jgi:ribosomal-protein-alanine N-acetyltransferase